MVSKELVTPDTIKRVFREHPPKVYLFHALQRKKVVEMTDSTSEEPPAFVRINKQPLTSQLLSSIEKEDAPVLREHDADRNAGFYVGYNNDTWQSPGEGCSDDPTKLVYRYAHRADAMLLIGEVLLGITGKVSLAHNFRITETANGWECTPDEISSD